MFVARVLFIRELLMFGVMNNIRAILPSWDEMYVMNIDGNMLHP